MDIGYIQLSNMNVLKKCLFITLIILFIPIFSAISSVFIDPGIPNGEQVVWRWTNNEEKVQILSILTWNVKNRNGMPVYEINLNSGTRKEAQYVIDKSDLRLVYAKVSEDFEDGRYNLTIDVKNSCQYLVNDFKGKHKSKDIDYCEDGYNGIILPFSLRGYPFGKKSSVEMHITPPYKPNVPLWAWKMWKAYAKYLGEEKVTVPAGAFDCYKLELGASGGLIKRFTSEYYFWFENKPPYRFVKYQDKDGKNVTELMEIRSKGRF